MKRHRGRPRTNHRIWELIRLHKCSRTWAYVLYQREQQNLQGKAEADERDTKKERS